MLQNLGLTFVLVNVVRRVGLLLLVVAIDFLVVMYLVRPWYRSWGATPAEAGRSLPGDSIVPLAREQETRAITILAPSSVVWQWVAQLGQDRGGFYSYDQLENLLGSEMPTVDTLRPGWQEWGVGDSRWMYPRRRAHGTGYAVLRRFEPGHALAFGTHAPRGSETAMVVDEGSWSFVLEPVTDSVTRFLIRGRGLPVPSLLGLAFDRTVFEPVHFIMERRMMLGLKDLAETGRRSRTENLAAILLWLILLVLALAYGVRTLRASRWFGPLAGFALSLAAFEYLTLRQPSVLVGVALVVGLGAAFVLNPLRSRY